MWQNIIVGVIVVVAAVSLVWRYLPARWRLKAGQLHPSLAPRTGRLRRLQRLRRRQLRTGQAPAIAPDRSPGRSPGRRPVARSGSGQPDAGAVIQRRQAMRQARSVAAVRAHLEFPAGR